MHTGTKFDHLGMDLDFEGDGGVAVSMFKHMDVAFDEFPEEVKGKAATPAANHLFDPREDGARLLPPEQASAFHHSSAQLLYVGSRARRDILTAVSFLTTRMKKPDADDWGQFKRVMKSLNGTRSLKMRLRINGIEDIMNLPIASIGTARGTGEPRK